MNLYHTTANPNEALQIIQTLHRQGHSAAMIPAGGLYQIYILPPTPHHNGHNPAKKAKKPQPKKQPFKWTFTHTIILITILSLIAAAISK